MVDTQITTLHGRPPDEALDRRFGTVLSAEVREELGPECGAEIGALFLFGGDPGISSSRIAVMMTRSDTELRKELVRTGGFDWLSGTRGREQQ